MQFLAQIFDFGTLPKPSTPSQEGGVLDVTPIHRGSMTSLGAFYTHTYIQFSLFCY